MLSIAYPADLYGDFFSRDYVSKFARSGVEAIYEFATHGFLNPMRRSPSELKAPALGPAARAQSFRTSSCCTMNRASTFAAAPGIKVPPGYQRHFQSFDGKARKLVVEGAGGPSWFTEYNVLTGLSARSYGRFATS